jgi:hypothetical protein
MTSPLFDYFAIKLRIGCALCIALLACTAMTAQAAQTAPASASSEQKRVSIAHLFEAIKGLVPEIAASNEIKADYQALLKAHALRHSDLLYADYVRVRIAFDATRAGGLWGVAWRITDEEPQSDLIWQQWRSQSKGALSQTTAIAECDELSALTAVVARGIGLSKFSEIGMLWPTSNHTVAVWTINQDKFGLDVLQRQNKFGLDVLPRQNKPVRIVLPTSQIFLDPQQSLDTRAFDPWKQKTIFDYRRKDVALTESLPATLASYFVAQVKAHAGRSQRELQQMRNVRERLQRSAVN